MGDERLVRFGFTAAIALFIGVGALDPYLVDQYAHLQKYLLDAGDEARELLSVLA